MPSPLGGNYSVIYQTQTSTQIDIIDYDLPPSTHGLVSIIRHSPPDMILHQKTIIVPNHHHLVNLLSSPERLTNPLGTDSSVPGSITLKDINMFLPDNRDLLTDQSATFVINVPEYWIMLVN